MKSDHRVLEAALNRRALLQLGAAAGLTGLLPSLAQAAARPDMLANVRALLTRWVGPGKFPGLVASLGRPGQAPEFVSIGSQGFTDPDPMTPDTLFRIYSMTKPITGMAAMHLIAQGKMALDQPVHEVLPQFKDMKVQNTYDGSITALHPAPRPITMRHLLTHTSGLGYAIVQRGPIVQLMERKGLIPGQVTRLPINGFTRAKSISGLKAFADALAQVPLVYDPGTHWSYSMGLDLMGHVIEVLSGKAFDQYLKETIFAPAGMKDTVFQVPRADAGRLATNYGVIQGIFVAIDEGSRSLFLEKPAAPFGGAGLVSTPRDYDRFLRMLAQFGQIDGRRVLSEKAVRLGTSNLLPKGVAGPTIMGPVGGFGAGGRVGLGPEAGVYGWAGAAGTVGMVDMVHGLRSQIFAQFMPADSMNLLPEFQTALKADVLALLEKR
ncbi:CubicO group peptidase (beta-lactamase class C family) [Novosphingobium chloroacetimidivorans]|uniref:CubicO group peptidase (Beta-lactamase class C family) n=1 Tax=Novosphingobium chloroacetimidivorans TaxID=1428314 RepID=A0A7W7K8M3_9SPHN|nr:serine hydrolase domain-containing protein [Novosphingobium chloroacetimidivorans]MBB4857709.1 CubicO group peptidase (beta-lactamase class C family) [Novosphingobium chloroacetimidivorans]